MARVCGCCGNEFGIWGGASLCNGEQVCDDCCQSIIEKSGNTEIKLVAFQKNLGVISRDEFMLMYVNPHLSNKFYANEQLLVSPFRREKAEHEMHFFRKKLWRSFVKKKIDTTVLVYDGQLDITEVTRTTKCQVENYSIPINDIQSCKSSVKLAIFPLILLALLFIFYTIDFWFVLLTALLLLWSYGREIVITTNSGMKYKIPMETKSEDTEKLLTVIRELKEEGVVKRDVREIQENSKKLCTACGYENESTFLFCNQCGEKLPQTIEKTEYTYDIKYCPDCGKLLPENKVCIDCKRNEATKTIETKEYKKCISQKYKNNIIKWVLIGGTFMLIILAGYVLKESLINVDKELKWKEAYLEYLHENGNADYGYSLDYIDEDNIPELVIDTMTTATGTILCGFDGKKVVETHVGEYLLYRRQENQFITGGGRMDYYYDKVYKIRKGKPVLVSSGVYGILDYDNILYDESGEAIYQYSWNDELVSVYDYYSHIEPFNYEEHAGIVCPSGNGYLYDIIEVLEHPLDITIIDPYINNNGYWGYINDYIVTFDGLMDDKIHFTVTCNDDLIGSVSATIIDSTTAEYQNDNSKLTIKFNVDFKCLEIEGHIGNIDLTGAYDGIWG